MFRVDIKRRIKCGITGHTGTIGKSIIKKNKKEIKFIFFKGNIIKKKEVEKWIKNNNFKYLIHLAAIVPIREVNKNKNKAFKVNTIGTSNLVKSIMKEENNIDWLFFASTSHVYSSSKKKD